MEIQVMPAKQLIALCPTDGAAVISTSLGVAEEKLQIPYVIARYDDVDMDGPRSFSKKQAGEFAAFIKSLGPDVAQLYICCDAGQSRSAAIAAATARYFGQDDDWIWSSPKYHPNMFCFERMIEAFGMRALSDGEMDCLIHKNIMAFRQAINRARGNAP